MQDKIKKEYNLEKRTFVFAQDVRAFVKRLPKTISNIEDGKQVIRSSGSVGANYIEACEAISKKDCLLRMRICRKEAKESHYWLRLVDCGIDAALAKERLALVTEAWELTLIYGAIVQKAI